MAGGRTQRPVLGAEPVRAPRSDAERNRARVLQAARELFAHTPIAEVSMDDVAAAASVGKGTVYRHVGDRAGLAQALLDGNDRQLQESLLSGPPPLGPGAPAAARLVAFLDALAATNEQHVDLLLVATGGQTGRFAGGPYPFWHLHVRVLLAEADPALDAAYLADALLAPLAPGLYRHQRHVLDMSATRISAGIRRLAEGLVGPV